MSFDYKIENDHLHIVCEKQNYWYYIGSLEGINSKVIENNPVAPAVNQLTIELGLLGIGFPQFTVDYNNITEGAKILNKVEQMINDLIMYTQNKKKIAHTRKAEMGEALLKFLSTFNR